MVLEGKSVFGGIAIGRLSIYNKKETKKSRAGVWKVRLLVYYLKRRFFMRDGKGA